MRAQHLPCTIHRMRFVTSSRPRFNSTTSRACVRQVFCSRPNFWCYRWLTFVLSIALAVFTTSLNIKLFTKRQYSMYSRNIHRRTLAAVIPPTRPYVFIRLVILFHSDFNNIARKMNKT